MDLLSRIRNINKRIARNDKLLQDTLRELKSKAQGDQAAFASWANGWGEYSLSTLYSTMLYFARAARIRSELPFVRLSSDDDEELLKKLSEVRKAFGGDYGIWESLQDSLGAYMWKGGCTPSHLPRVLQSTCGPIYLCLVAQSHSFLS